MELMNDTRGEPPNRFGAFSDEELLELYMGLVEDDGIIYPPEDGSLCSALASEIAAAVIHP